MIINDICEKAKRLYVDYVNDVITEDEYDKGMDAVLRELADIKNR